jgi:hypothetical protein
MSARVSIDHRVGSESVATQGPGVDDPLALLAADPRLVVGVDGVGQSSFSLN